MLHVFLLMDSSKSALNSTHSDNTEHNETNFKQTTHCLWLSGKKKFHIRKVLDHWTTTASMAILTVYALFGDDIKVWSTPASFDLAFNIVTIICMFLFTVEIIFAAVSKDDYWLHFFFWLDILSTASLITDLTWVWEAIEESIESDSTSATNQTSQIARAGRASRAGTRAGRMIRIIRLVRLIRIAKLYRHAVDRTVKEQAIVHEDPEYGGPLPFPDDPEDDTVTQTGERVTAVHTQTIEDSESRVGKRLSELTTRKVIIIVLVMLIAVPLLSEDQWLDYITSELYGAVSIVSFATDYAQSSSSGRASDLSTTIEGSWYSYQHSLLQYLYFHSEGLINDPIFYIKLPYALTLSEEEINAYRDLFDVPDSVFEYIKSDDAINDGVTTSNDRVIPSELRYNEYDLQYLIFCEIPVPISTSCPDEYSKNFKAYFDIRYSTKLSACLSIVRTIFVCIVLATGSMLLSKDANDLVLAPIESMIKKVESIRRQPMNAVKLANEEAEKANQKQRDGEADTRSPRIEKYRKKEDDLKGRDYSVRRRGSRNENGDRKDRKEENKLSSQLVAAVRDRTGGGDPKEKDAKKKGDPYETAILEKTILKIGGLLALGFGEAGGEIIANSMTGDGSLNSAAEGKKISAIFGFCDIRQFTDATEVLKAKVMTFVNQIAEIVHSWVDTFGGAPNKNIGDAFLLVWKFEKKEGSGYKKSLGDVDNSLNNTSSSKKKGVDRALIAKTSDMSVMSFIKIIAAIRRSHLLEVYNNDPGLQERIKGYRVQMGFGLHIGWAIEGAIGSSFKIDASYLSPNVNMASRLEAATKQYGVPLLISGALYDACTPQMQTYMRQIDRVTVKGSNMPMALFTVDVNPNALKPIDVDHVISKQRTERLRLSLQSEMRNVKFSIYSLFDSDPDVAILRSHVSERFLTTFRRGYAYYEAGEWLQAKNLFEECREIMYGATNRQETDHPSETLLRYMEEFGFDSTKVENGWKGYRALTEK